MRQLMTIVTAAAAVVGGLVLVHAQKQRLNPVIALVEQGKPVFGVYAPSAFPPGGRRGAPPPPDVTPKTPIELAREALAYKAADYLFNGSMEGGVDRALPAVTDFVKAMSEAAGPGGGPFFGLVHPLIVRRRRSDPTTPRRPTTSAAS